MSDTRKGSIVRGTDQDFARGDAIPRASSRAGHSAAFRLDLQRAFAMHGKVAMLAGFLVFALVFLVGLTRKKHYSAETIFYVAPVQREVLNANGPTGYDDMRYSATLQQLMQTMQRMDVAEKAVRSLPEGVWRAPNEPVRVAAANLIGNLSVQRSGSSFQMVADLTGDDPDATAAALNALAATFIAQVKNDTDGPTEQQMKLLEAEQQTVADALVKDQDKQARLSAALGVARLSTDKSNPLDDSVAQLRQQLFSVEQARQQTLTQASGNSGESNDALATPAATLLSSLNSRKATLQSQMAGMTPANPIYQQDQVELAATDRELTDATAKFEKDRRDREQTRRHELEARSAGLERELKDRLLHQTELAARSAPQLQEYASLTAETDRLQTRANAIDDAMRGIEVQRRSPSFVRVAIPATPPLLPEPGKRKLLLLGSVPLGIFVAIAVAVLLNSRERRIFVGRDVERILGFRPMAVLPAAEEVSEPVRDSYLLRLAGAIENSYRNGARTFAFTAPSPETDVEELVFHLQNKLKEMGYAVLWVGSDTLLRAERDFEEAYGRGPDLSEEARHGEHGTDGLAAARLAWLQGDYDFVLVDTPSLTISGEAEYAVRRCDATVLVNESAVTTREDLYIAGEILERIGLGGVGAVVKNLKLENADVLFQHTVQKAEEDHARRAPREPRDNEGTWQVLEAGTTRELVLPGDPVARNRRRRRPANAASPKFTSVS
ncbi:exopolysaccharide transport family protein [Granulicella cerasi]|uniref:Exopolysaccharide transport family protein n=1 Tax=Granulicella cerasi TaxID=741063 RepID=A0ABW1ZBV0_9BACT|nr:hypothetical protein [Granulicella cerasi]